MGEDILLVAVLLLALYGCTQLIRWLVLRIVEPPVKDKGVRLYPIRGHRDDLEFIVRAAVVQRRWSGLLVKPERVVLLDAGMDEETRALARRLCRPANGVELWEAKELGDIFTSGLQEADLSL